MCRWKFERDKERKVYVRHINEALKFADDQLAANPPPGPPLLTALQQKQAEWRQLLATLP